MCSSNNSSDKESAGSTSDNTGGCFTDDASHNGASSCGHASLANLAQNIQFGKECGIVQGRIGREPVDTARYVVVGGSNGTMFACSRCSKQYIHRKSCLLYTSDAADE